MAASLPTLTFRRATTCLNKHHSLPQTPTKSTQIRHASLLRRPHRPYTFTQLVTLSDGSVYLHRTTSPAPIYKSTKDTRNHIMWNPSLTSLRNIEEDEAGRLKAFRSKFGRGWDVDGGEEEASGDGRDDVSGDGVGVGGGSGKKEGGRRALDEEQGSLMDLMSSAYAASGKVQDMKGRVQVVGGVTASIKKKVKGKK